jgi:Spy/CpxP family protein refolding chaperone
MTIVRCLAASALLLLAPVLVAAQPMEPPLDAGGGMGGPPGLGRPAFLDAVFPPGLVMRHQAEIGLTAEQRETITRAMSDAQSALADVQWQAEAEREKLDKLLREERVDEAAALAQADAVMRAEQRVKLAHLRLLVRIKNALTAEQQQKLQALRDDRGGRWRGR